MPNDTLRERGSERRLAELENLLKKGRRMGGELHGVGTRV